MQTKEIEFLGSGESAEVGSFEVGQRRSLQMDIAARFVERGLAKEVLKKKPAKGRVKREVKKDG
ncbi:MAG: hypothetical protein V3T30_08875 [Thermodesulfobacteriota bacterium]